MYGLGYINSNEFYDEEIYKELLVLSQKGDCLILALNIIGLIKPSNLNIDFCMEFVNNLKFIFLGFKVNKEILKCHNPIFAICLSAEILGNMSYRIII